MLVEVWQTLRYRFEFDGSPEEAVRLVESGDWERGSTNEVIADRVLVRPDSTRPAVADTNPGYGMGRFDFTADTEEGTTFTPWTDGWAVGYKITAPGLPDRYLVLNPSQTDDTSAFVYLDEAGEDHQNPVCYVTIWPDDAMSVPQQCQATDRFGNRCARPEHPDDKKYPGHSFPKTAEQATIEQDDALANLTKFLGE